VHPRRALPTLLLLAMLPPFASCRRATSGSPSRPGDPSPAEILEKALAVREPGGVKEHRGWCAKGRGTMHYPKGPIAVVMDSCQIGIDRVRIETLEPEPFRSVYVDDGTAAWERTASGIRIVGAEERQDMHRAGHVDWVLMLWPLRYPEYRLTSMGRFDARGVTTLGVRVSRDGERDVELYVDPGTWRIVKRGGHDEDLHHEAVYDETFYSEWRAADGVRYASHAEKLRNGKPRSTWDLELSFPDVLDETQFRRPDP
jgi:hypothetical protein